MLRLLRGTASEHNFRGILLMLLEQRLTITEIAERMNIDPKSVAARIKGLRALFNEELPTPGDAIYRARGLPAGSQPETVEGATRLHHA
jgi:hypothetical protein